MRGLCAVVYILFDRSCRVEPIERSYVDLVCENHLRKLADLTKNMSWSEV